MNPPLHSWREAFATYLNPRVVGMLFLGFSAGLPYLLVFSTLTAWLSDTGISLSAIGFFGWVGVTYSLKVFWAPVIDRVGIAGVTRYLGKRRGWILCGQAGIITGLFIMSLFQPQENLMLFALLALLVAFSSATQDIAIDAYRIEAVVTEYQGAMSAMYILGYRVALLVAGALSLLIADIASWSIAYMTMSGLMAVGVVTVLLIKEPDHPQNQEPAANTILPSDDQAVSESIKIKRWFIEAVCAPFIEFFQRNGRFALVILAFIGLFRLSDITMGVMANPFYLDLGFSKSEIASVSKVFGFFMTIFGSFIGGVFVVRYGVYKPLLAGAVLLALTNLLFAQLALADKNVIGLAVVISADNLSGGFSNTAFIAYLSGLTNRAYTATQFALFSSLMTLPGKFLSGFSGIIVEAYDYHYFFIYSASMGIPAIILAVIVLRQERDCVQTKECEGTNTHPSNESKAG